MKTFIDDTFNNFCKTNEYTQNKSVLKIIFWCLITVPFLLLGKYSGIFPNLHVNILISCICVFGVGYLVSFVLFKIRPFSPLIKYFLLFILELDIVILSFDSGVLLFIGYILVPLISCIYLDRKFSIQVLITCYIFMILSLLYRAYYVVPTYSSGISSKSWAMQYIFFLSLGYLINSMVVFIVGKRNSMIINEDYKGIVKEFNSQIEITASYVEMLSQKQPSLEKHVTNCSLLVKVICEILQKNKKYSEELTQKTIFNYVTAAYLHDVGIISIPDSILNKKTELTDKEMSILKTHTILGNKLIKENMSEMDKDFLQIVCDMILYHHEQWDGNGYPYGIYHEEIPLSGRVIATANIMEKYLFGFNYIKSISFEETIKKIDEMSGRYLDPEIVKEILKNKNIIYQTYNSIMSNKK